MSTPDDVRHFPELDGIRGIAILMVMLSHGMNGLGVVPWKGTPGFYQWGRPVIHIFLQGWGGVDVFFALSGFLITGILLRARKKPMYFSSFYARRTLRIFPIYYAFLVVTLLVLSHSHSFSSLLPKAPRGVLPYFLYLQNWPIFWDSWAGMTGLWGAYWSLAVEEQFYMVWPSIVRFCNLRFLLGVCVVGALSGSFMRAHLMHVHGLRLGMIQSPFSRLDGLFIGAGIALYRHISGRPLAMRWAVLAMISGAFIIGYVALIHPDELEGIGAHLWTVGPAGFALFAGGLIAASHYRPPVLHAILSSKPLLVAGRLSYGMYVYHILIYLALELYVIRPLRLRLDAPYAIWFAAAFLLFAFLLVTGVAALSFRFFETPFLRLKRHFPSPSAPV